MKPFRFGLFTSVASTMAAWRDSSRRAEELGYSAVYVMDHLGAQFAPLVAMTVAAEATTTLHVGTLVLNNGLRNPVVLAKEIATLGLAAEGRVEVGLGAGWLPGDFDETGIEQEDPARRVSRLDESLAVMTSLWREGETTFSGQHYQVRGARCAPRPSAAPLVIVGGGSRRILDVAARRADIVNISLPARQGADLAGSATVDHFDRCVGWVEAGAGGRFADLELQIVLSAVVEVGSQRAATRSLKMLGFGGDDALELPIVLTGTHDEMCERLLARRERWGFSNIVVAGDAMESFAPVVAQLAGT